MIDPAFLRCGTEGEIRWVPSLLAAMGTEGLVGTMTIEGGTNTEVFLPLDQVLRPALRPGQTVTLDNL